MNVTTPHTQRFRALALGPSEGWRAQVREALESSPADVVEDSGEGGVLDRLRDSGEIDVVVLDGVLPRETGLALLRRIRECPELASLPVLILSERSTEMDRVLAFENGADDFLSVPFFSRELVSRVRALLRRSRGALKPERQDAVSFGGAAIHLDRGRVEIGGREIHLTRREFDVLRILIGKEGAVVRRTELLEELRGTEDDTSPRLIDTYIKSIRQKLGVAGGHIGTVRGVGYRFDRSA